ncbi:MAG: hypothetical protein OEY33_01105 [Bdellovibrionales bacterium]|nr:hypothetical protein [Bdellovibrionales bacterium]
MENIVEEVVRDFYQKAVNDFMIGHHFRKIAEFKPTDPLETPLEAFSGHIPRIVEFWKTQLLGHKSSESFNLISAHEYLLIKKGELGRWVVLFKEVLQNYKGKYPDHESFFLLWEQKILHFQNKFLNSTQLFGR